jgi:hypothetical protein
MKFVKSKLIVLPVVLSALIGCGGSNSSTGAGRSDSSTCGFANCSAALAQGVTDIPRSSLLYCPKLDRDNDGIACES